MATPRRTIPFHILLRLAPRAVALLWKIITARRSPMVARPVARAGQPGARSDAPESAVTPHTAPNAAAEEAREAATRAEARRSSLAAERELVA